jgi:hypothetical protein
VDDDIATLDEMSDDLLLQEEEDIQEDVTGDTSRRRLGQLKAIIKNVMYKHRSETITEAHFAQIDKDMTIQELQVSLPIAAMIAPYIPSKENHYFIGFQLPFVLFANDVLRYAGYSKFCRNYCPLPSPTKLDALSIDVPSIYAIFSRTKNKPITLFDLEGFPINSDQQARSRKDATFHAFLISAKSEKCVAPKSWNLGTISQSCLVLKMFTY